MRRADPTNVIPPIMIQVDVCCILTFTALQIMLSPVSVVVRNDSFGAFLLAKGSHAGAAANSTSIIVYSSIQDYFLATDWRVYYHFYSHTYNYILVMVFQFLFKRDVYVK